MNGTVNTAACFGDYVTETLRKTLPNVISLTLLFIASFQLQKMEYACKITHQRIDFMRHFTYKDAFTVID